MTEIQTDGIRTARAANSAEVTAGDVRQEERKHGNGGYESNLAKTGTSAMNVSIPPGKASLTSHEEWTANWRHRRRAARQRRKQLSLHGSLSGKLCTAQLPSAMNGALPVNMHVSGRLPVSWLQLQKLSLDVLDDSEQRIAIDLSFTYLQNPWELVSLTHQIRDSYALIKRMPQPFALHIFEGIELDKDVGTEKNLTKEAQGVAATEETNQQIREMNGIRNETVGNACYDCGKEWRQTRSVWDHLNSLCCSSWYAGIHRGLRIEDILPLSSICYLSPDASSPLSGPLDPNVVYVIGGLIDRTRKRGASLRRATSLGVSARRLPLEEHGMAGIARDLNVTTVIAVLAGVRAHGDWGRALQEAVPARVKGRRRKDGVCGNTEKSALESVEEVAQGGDYENSTTLLCDEHD